MDPLEKTVKTLLEQRRGDWRAIADAADVSHSWLSKFVRGKIPNPGLRTLERVRDAMSERKAAKATQ
jgi:transcriptional regulator with XRE-family HTH domain